MSNRPNLHLDIHDIQQASLKLLLQQSGPGQEQQQQVLGEESFDSGPTAHPSSSTFTSTSSPTPPPQVVIMADECGGEAVATTHMHLRIASIFIILVAAMIGTLIPLVLTRYEREPVPRAMLFVSKYVGSGVIIATAWMHLLAPAAEELGDPCLEGILPDYDWAFFIALATILLMTFAEMIATHLGQRHDMRARDAMSPLPRDDTKDAAGTERQTRQVSEGGGGGRDDDICPVPECRQQHADTDTEANLSTQDTLDGKNHHRPNLAAQLTGVLILEFGVVFHSILIGLVLATTSEFTVLLIALVFHQLLEGLGLGARLAAAPWPGSRWWLPYLLAFVFAISTPVGTAAGLGVKPTGRAEQILITGIFDSISAGVLMYTGLVELIAHEFLAMKDSSLRRQLLAFGCVVFGAGVMAALAHWA